MDRAAVGVGRLVDRRTRTGRVTVDVAQVAQRGRVLSIRAAATVDGVVTIDDEVRIVNPPTLVPDPNGDVVVGRVVDPDGTVVSEGERYRHDPEAAIAEVLTQVAQRQAGSR